MRSDYPDLDPAAWHKFITLKWDTSGVMIGEKTIDYYGSLKENYEIHNRDYILEGQDGW